MAIHRITKNAAVKQLLHLVIPKSFTSFQEIGQADDRKMTRSRGPAPPLWASEIRSNER